MGKFRHPRLNDIDKEKVTNFYAKIRKESSAVGGIPIAVRHIESVLRMSEAHAKMHLRDYVRTDDIDFAINMLLDSFLQSQKASVGRALSKKFEQFNFFFFFFVFFFVQPMPFAQAYTGGRRRTSTIR